MSDILKNPTAMLAKALAPKSIAEGYAAFMRLHRHKLAGGALPAQERGEGTAVGALLREARANANSMAATRRSAAQATRAAIRAVTGEGSPAVKRDPTGKADAPGRKVVAEELLTLCGPDLAGRPLDVLLDTVADVLNQGGGGPLVDCLRAKAEQARAAVAKLEGA